MYWTHFSYRHGLSRRSQYVYMHSLTERCSELDFGISSGSENTLSQFTCNWMTDKNVYFSSTLGGTMRLFRGFIGPPFGWSPTLHNKQQVSWQAGILKNRKMDHRTVCHGNILTVNVRSMSVFVLATLCILLAKWGQPGPHKFKDLFEG